MKFYVGQKAFLRKENQVLVMTSADRAGATGLDFPGGKINVGETNLAEALQREVREETSLEIKVGNAFTTWTNDWTTDKYSQGEIFIVGYICDYISGEVELSSEHTDFEWVNKDNYRKLDDGSRYFQALEEYFKVYNILRTQ